MNSKVKVNTLSNNLYYKLQGEKDEELVEQLFDSPRTGTKPDANSLYDEFFRGEFDSLRKEMAELDVEVEMRKAIHSQLVDELDHQVLSASLFLNDLKHWGIVYYTYYPDLVC